MRLASGHCLIYSLGPTIPIEFNSEQKAAVTQLRGAVVVKAGAGAGKTRVLTARAAAILDSGEGLLFSTFTGKAAGEMRARLAETHAHEISSRRAMISTLHAFALNEIIIPLAEDDELGPIGRQPNLRLAVRADELAGLHDAAWHRLPKSTIDLLEQSGLGVYELNTCLGIVRANGTPSDEIMPSDAIEAAQTAQYDENTIALIEVALPDYGAYLEAAQREANVIDFDGLLVCALALLRAHSYVRKELAALYPYIQVDEFQDTNRVQLRLVTEIARDAGNICVVGDDRQAIYSFRGADAGIFDRFKERYPHAAELSLRSNYRSSQLIVNVANASASAMLDRRHLGVIGDMVAGRRLLQPQRPAWWVFDSETREAEAVVTLLESLPDNHTALVIYRRRKIKTALENALNAHEITYELLDDSDFFKIKEVVWALEMVRALIDTDARYPWIQALKRTPVRLTKAELAEIWDEDGGYEALAALTEHGNNEDGDNKELAALLASFARVREPLLATEARQNTEFSRPGELTAALAELWNQWLAPYLDKSFEKNKDLKDDADRLEARKLTGQRRVMYFFDIVQRAWWRKGNIRTAMDRIEAYGPRNDSDEKGTSPVVLSTVHKSKGLEADTVVYLGGGDVASGEAESTEEERRVFYVAVTRPRDRLLVTESEFRPSLGKEASKRNQSPFMQEIEYYITRDKWTDKDDLAEAIRYDWRW